MPSLGMHWLRHIYIYSDSPEAELAYIPIRLLKAIHLTKKVSLFYLLCRVFVGTVSEFCVKHAECPVITIKRSAEESPQDPVDD